MNGVNWREYRSPLGTRYGSHKMIHLWSEYEKRYQWRKVWIAVAKARGANKYHIQAMERVLGDVDVDMSLEAEAVTKHDLVAELEVFARQAEIKPENIHWVLTSSDIQDNAEIVRQRTALHLILHQVVELLGVLKDKSMEYADHVIMGKTHLQDARPTILGYRFANYTMELAWSQQELSLIERSIRGKGIKGPVGTYRGMENNMKGCIKIEREAMAQLSIGYHKVATQTYPRIQDAMLLGMLANCAAVVHHIAQDMRLMKMSSEDQILRESKTDGQVGSSAMPEKVNPIREEKACSLARIVAANYQVAWQNAATQMFERTLDDSANRRVIIPESFIALEEALMSLTAAVKDAESTQDPTERPILGHGELGIAPELAVMVARGIKDVHG